MATPQPCALTGMYTIAAGPANLQDNLPAHAYPFCIAWAIDRTPDAGYMVSNGTAWTSNAGPPGTNGNTILSGTGAPSGGAGVNGDFYVDVTVMRMYGPKTAGVWGSGVSLVGPAGAGTPGNNNPIIAGTAAAGAATAYSREDHVHPAQTVPIASNATPQPLGTAASGTSPNFSRADHVHTLPTIPGPSATTPLIASGVGAIGVGTTYARNDHVHPAQTVPTASNASPQALGTAAPGSSPDFSRADHVHTLPAIPAAASTTPLVASGAGAVGVGTTFARNDHVHPAQSYAATVGPPNNRTVAFATAYQATDNTKAAAVNVIVDCTTTITIGAPQANTVEMFIGATNAVASGTGTLADTFRSDLSVTLISLGWTGRQSLKALIPAGWWFALRRTVGTGMTVVSSYDQALA